MTEADDYIYKVEVEDRGEHIFHSMEDALNFAYRYEMEEEMDPSISVYAVFDNDEKCYKEIDWFKLNSDETKSELIYYENFPFKISYQSGLSRYSGDESTGVDYIMFKVDNETVLYAEHLIHNYDYGQERHANEDIEEERRLDRLKAAIRNLGKEKGVSQKILLALETI
jgi:hypothetical protein